MRIPSSKYRPRSLRTKSLPAGLLRLLLSIKRGENIFSTNRGQGPPVEDCPVRPLPSCHPGVDTIFVNTRTFIGTHQLTQASAIRRAMRATFAYHPEP